MSDDENSSKSQTSIGFPSLKSSEESPVTGSDESLASNATLEQVDLSEPDSLKHFIPKDAICLVVICELHHVISLQSVSNCYFLPSVEIDCYQQSFSELIIPVLAEMLPNYDLTDDSVNPQLRVQLVDQYRVQLPKTNRFLQRFIFRTCFYLTTSVLDEDESNTDYSSPCICNNMAPTNSEDRIWLSIEELKLRRDNIWGGELIEYFCSSTGNLDGCRLVEFDTDYPKQSLAAMKHLYEGLSSMESTSVYLFNAFVVHCFPSNTMSFTSFCDFCDRLCWMIDIETRRKIFRSFDRHCRGFLDYIDLLEGLILFDSENGHTEINDRHDYVFRYYDSNQDRMLEYDEFRQLVLDFYHVNSGALQAILRSINNTRSNYLNETVEGLWTELVKSHGVNSMSFDKYHKAFDQMNNLIGCRVCWLPTVSCLEKVNQRFNCRTIAESNLQRLVEKNIILSQCEMCMTIKYSLSSLSVHLDLAGQVDRFYHYKPISSLEFIEEFPEKNIFRLANEFMIRIEKIGFNQSMLRLSADNLSLDYFFSNRDKMLHYLYQIVDFAKRLFENESKLLELTSPGFVFGDISGQLQDLLHLRQSSFRTYPTIDASFLLFLGNYIAPESYYNLECLIYLLCLKVLTPDKIFLIRCCHKKNEYLKITSALQEEPVGLEIVRIIASIFDSLPVAAVVDHKIYAAHSGIPMSVNSIYMIKSMANWNDSIDNTVEQEYTYNREQNTVSASQNWYCEPSGSARPMAIAILDQVVQQLTSNTPSDTEQVGTFTRHQLNRFLVHNNLCTMIRSHPRQETEKGFHSSFHYGLVTLRSSAFPTCAFLDQTRLRLILLDVPDVNSN